jgi:CheY-like chemotaxis protein
LLKEQPFDVVLMDVQMPEMDGLEATRIVRQLERQAQLAPQPRTPIPIVAMTAHAMKGDRERCLESGMNGYVTKPVRSRDLQEALAAFFSGADATPTDAPAAAIAAAVDWPSALRSTDGDVDLLHLVAQAFLKEIGEHQARLRSAVTTGDAATVQRLGHLIKGLTTTWGADDARASAERLETMGRQRNVATAAPSVDALDSQLRALIDTLTAFVAGRITP